MRRMVSWMMAACMAIPCLANSQQGHPRDASKFLGMLATDDPSQPSQTAGSGLYEQLVDSDRHLLASGDMLRILVFGKTIDEYSADVDASGYIVLSELGGVYVGGKSLADAKREISAFLRKNTRFDSLTISLMDGSQFLVPVAGAVRNPGVYQIGPQSRVSTLIEMAGGILSWGRKDSVIIRNGETANTVNLLEFRVSGAFDENPFLSFGNRVVVPWRAGDHPLVTTLWKGRVVDISWFKGMKVAHVVPRQDSASEKEELHSIQIFRTGKTWQTGDMHTPLNPGDTVKAMFARLQVYVQGAVVNPGGFPYSAELGPEDYVGLAGGRILRASRGCAVIRNGSYVKDDASVEVMPGDRIQVKQDWIQLAGDYLSLFSGLATLALLWLTLQQSGGS